MKNDDQDKIDVFEKLVESSLSEEVQPLDPDEDEHPSLESMYSALAGDLPSSSRAALSRHLATCTKCQRRWRKLSRVIDEEYQTLNEEADIPSFSSLGQAQEKEEAGKERSVIRRWLNRFAKTVNESLPSRPAVLIPSTAAVTALIAVAIILPLLMGPTPSEKRITELTTQVKNLSQQVNNLTMGTEPFSYNNMSQPPQVSKEELDAFLKKLNETPGTWEKALTIDSFLITHNIVVPREFDWSNLKSYKVGKDGNWKEIAEDYFGRSGLWALLYLINGGDTDLQKKDSVLVPETR